MMPSADAIAIAKRAAAELREGAGYRRTAEPANRNRNPVELEAGPPADDRPPVESFEEFELSADAEPDLAPDGAAAIASSTSSAKPEQDKEIRPFETFDASRWEGVPIPPRRWIVGQRIPEGEPGIMSGDGGTGKTKLALQLAAAISTGLQDWVGNVVEAEGPVIVFSAEEKLAEMHRRTADVIKSRGLDFDSLKNRLHFICDSEDPVLGAVGRNGVVQPTMPLLRLEKTVEAIRPALVLIENAADVYGGNEIDRTNVTRFMRSILGRLTAPSAATVMLIQHPSVSGLSDGTGRSGSTGWNNSGRWRCNFTRLKDDDEARQLEFVKNNYGPDRVKVQLRWERGVYVPEGSIASPHRVAADHAVDELFLRLLDKRLAQGRPIRPSTGRGSAPAELADDPEANGTTAAAFKAAMERLFTAGKIVTIETGPPTRRTKHIERVQTYGQTDEL
jgi:RecA-family ATPase